MGLVNNLGLCSSIIYLYSLVYNWHLLQFGLRALSSVLFYEHLCYQVSKDFNLLCMLRIIFTAQGNF